VTVWLLFITPLKELLNVCQDAINSNYFSHYCSTNPEVMSLTKVLHSIRTQISEIIPALESFSDSNVQPGTGDCELLQKQLCELQENLAIYKFTQKDMDFSPSYKIHAKISEKEPDVPVAENQKKEESPEPAPASRQPEVPVAIPVAAPVAPTTSQTTKIKPFVIGLNDKFRFINELFSQNNPEYNIAYQQLSTLNTWNESEIYLNSLKNLYGWKENSDVVKYFYSIVKKRFD